MKSVKVLIGSPPAEVARLGVTQDRLRVIAELRLRQAGIPVVDVADKNPPLDCGFVYVKVGVLPSAYAVEVKVLEPMVLLRDHKTMINGAISWERGFFEAGSGSKSAERVSFRPE